MKKIAVIILIVIFLILANFLVKKPPEVEHTNDFGPDFIMNKNTPTPYLPVDNTTPSQATVTPTPAKPITSEVSADQSQTGAAPATLAPDDDRYYKDMLKVQTLLPQSYADIDLEYNYYKNRITVFYSGNFNEAQSMVEAWQETNNLTSIGSSQFDYKIRPY